jgi:hypothetical protein
MPSRLRLESPALMADFARWLKTAPDTPDPGMKADLRLVEFIHLTTETDALAVC